MNDNRADENYRAVRAKESVEKKNLFLSSEQTHILRLTAHILKRTVSDSDDEFSVAMLAVSEAVDSYDEDKGPFWNYAARVIRSRILDDVRKKNYRDRELLTDPASFSGDVDYEDPGSIKLREELNRKTAVYTDHNLKYEIEALEQELSEYGIELFELPEYSPKSEKTKTACTDLIKRFFDPPPLTELFRKKKSLPVKEMLLRSSMNRKTFDRHRKYILASILVKDGDYEGIGAFLD
ncbi:MAG: hypothetical protein K5668_02240 [Lachnospiraceae bacterium]|nr:hypothetical protein [Lachnospiraceae bacterium]